MLSTLSRYRLMSFELAFHPEALREWHKLDTTVRDQFKKKLAECLATIR